MYCNNTCTDPKVLHVCQYPVIMTDSDGFVIYLNKRFSNIFGFEIKTFPDHNIYSFFDKSNKGLIDSIYKKIHDRNTPQDYLDPIELLANDNYNNKHQLKISVTFEKTNEGDYNVVFFLIDNFELSKRREEIEEYKSKLNELHKIFLFKSEDINEYLNIILEKVKEILKMDYCWFNFKSNNDIYPNSAQKYSTLYSNYLNEVITKSKTVFHRKIFLNPKKENENESFLGTPIIINNKIYATLSFASKIESNITQSDIELVEIIAKFLSNKIEEINKNIEITNKNILFESIFKSVPLGLILTDSNRNISNVNDAITHITGYNKEELIGNNISMLHINEDEYIKYNILYNSKSKDINTNEIKLKKKSGELFLSETIHVKINSKDINDSYLDVIQDISKRKSIQKELLEEKLKAETSAYTKGLFLASMSHEIRTPLNAIFGVTQMLSKTDLTDKQKKYSDTITKASESLLVIINDILDISKISSEEFLLECYSFDIIDTIKTINNLTRNRAEQKNLDLNFDIPIDLKRVIVQGDQVRLSQILLNLLNNAIKYTKEGFVTFKLNIAKETYETVNLKFTISDSGIGIKKDKLSHIFDNFTQLSYDYSSESRGVGLGLSITKKLVDLYGGKIEVSSIYGKGSTFSVSIEFPKGDEKSFVNNINEISNINNENSLKGIKILYADDAEFNQIVMQSMCEFWGCELESAKNGEEAFDKISNNNYDIILMDIKMPVLDGIETTKLIRNKLAHPKNNIPIIAFTAHAILGMEKEYYDAGMNDYVKKPFRENELLEKIKKLLNIENKKDDMKENIPIESSNNIKKTSYDLKGIIELSRGNNDFIKNIVNKFKSQALDLNDNLVRLIKEKNIIEIANILHKVKPSFKMIEANDIFKLIIDIEANCKKENYIIENISNDILLLANKITLLIEEMANNGD